MKKYKLITVGSAVVAIITMMVTPLISQHVPVMTAPVDMVFLNNVDEGWDVGVYAAPSKDSCRDYEIEKIKLAMRYWGISCADIGCSVSQACLPNGNWVVQGCYEDIKGQYLCILNPSPRFIPWQNDSIVRQSVMIESDKIYPKGLRMKTCVELFDE